jgi:drug/metabolite transporter (DMT)-like permease
MQPSPKDPVRRAELGALARVAFAGIIWGTIPLVLRAADGASVVKVFYRVFFAAVGILIWMTATRRLREVTGLSRRKLSQVAAQGVLLTVNWVLFLSALDRTSVATAELLGYTGPVFVAVFAPFVTGERFDRRILVPLGLSLGGIAVILVPQGLSVSNPRELFGAALAFCSALTYATLLLRSKKILKGISGLSLMLVEYTVASAVLLPFVAWLYARGQGPTTPTAYAALLTLGLVQTAFSGVFFLSGLRRLRTDHAAILTYAEPVSAVAFAALFLAEPLTPWTLAGGAMVVAGGLVVARLPSRAEPEPLPLEMAGVEPDLPAEWQGLPAIGHIPPESADADRQSRKDDR